MSVQRHLHIFFNKAQLKGAGKICCQGNLAQRDMIYGAWVNLLKARIPNDELGRRFNAACTVLETLHILYKVYMLWQAMAIKLLKMNINL